MLINQETCRLKQPQLKCRGSSVVAMVRQVGIEPGPGDPQLAYNLMANFGNRQIQYINTKTMCFKHTKVNSMLL